MNTMKELITSESIMLMDNMKNKYAENLQQLGFEKETRDNLRQSMRGITPRQS